MSERTYMYIHKEEAHTIVLKKDTEPPGNTTQHNKIEQDRYSTVQHSTVQHSTVQHSTVQHSKVQHSTVQHSTKLAWTEQKIVKEYRIVLN